MKLLSPFTAALTGLLVWVSLASAQTASRTLDGLPNYSSGGVPAARNDTLTVTLAPDSGPIRGLRGTTVGWGFSITWQSNAGDKLAFTGSRLLGDASAVTAGYKDYIGILSGKTNGITSAGETWTRAFVANRGGLGAVPIRSTALPGSGYVGQLRLNFNVYDSRGPDLGETLGSFEMLLDVSVIVDAEDPVEQTITFASIADTTYGSAPFTVSPTASSGLPVTLTSLNPEVCTVAGNTVTIVGAGACTLLAAQAGDTQYNAAPLVTRTFEVAKAPAAIVIAGRLTQIFSGAPKSLSALPQPGGLNVKLLYGGDTVPPTALGNHFVTALIDEPNYQGSAENFLSIVRGVSQTDWRAVSFTTSEQANTAISGPLADPDGDGVPNVLEYALALDPMTASAAGQPKVTRNNGVLNLTYVRRMDVSDLNYTVEVSSDLITWQSGSSYTREVSATALDRIREQVVVADLTPLSTVTTRFIRLRVQVVASGAP